MSQATGSRVQLAYVAESTYGVTPVTPQMTLLDFVSFNGDLNPTILSSNTIRANRMRTFARRGSSSTEGTLEFELNPQNYETFLQAALMGTWTADVLKVGSTRRSFAIEQGFTDIAEYRVFNGVVISSFSLSVPSNNELVTGSFGMLGTTTTAFSGTPLDATPTAAVANDIFFHEGGTFAIDGVPVGYLSSIEMTLENNYEQTFALGVTGARDTLAGVASLTGTVTALFEDTTAYDSFINNDDVELEFTLTAGTPAKTLTFRIPRLKFTQGAIPVADDGPVNVELQFEAIDDGVDGILVITRAN